MSGNSLQLEFGFLAWSHSPNPGLRSCFQGCLCAIFELVDTGRVLEVVRGHGSRENRVHGH